MKGGLTGFKPRKCRHAGCIRPENAGMLAVYMVWAFVFFGLGLIYRLYQKV